MAATANPAHRASPTAAGARGELRCRRFQGRLSGGAYGDEREHRRKGARCGSWPEAGVSGGDARSGG